MVGWWGGGVRGVFHVVTDPFREIGDLGINGRIRRVCTTTAPAHYSNLQPDVLEFTDEWAPRVTLEKRRHFL